MAIEQRYRGKGYGQKLVNRMVEKLREQGYKQLSLSVDKRNRAFNFYQRLGFRIVGEEGNAYIMVRSVE